MHRLVFGVILISSVWGATNYDAGDGHSRREAVDSNGDIRGEYTYVDPAGKTIAVRYSAGKNGFQIENPGTASPVAYATTPVPPSAPEYRNFPGLPPQFQYQPNPFSGAVPVGPTPRSLDISASPAPPSAEDYRLAQFRQPAPQNIQYQPVTVASIPAAEFRNFPGLPQFRPPTPENVQYQQNPFNGVPQPAPVFENQQQTPTDKANTQQRFFPVPAGFNPTQLSAPGTQQFPNDARFAGESAVGTVLPFSRALFAPSSGSERAESARQIQQYSDELRNETSQALQPGLPSASNPFAAPERFAPLPPLTPEQRQAGGEGQFLPGQGPQQFVPIPAQQEERRFEFLPPQLSNTPTNPGQVSFEFPASPIRGSA